MLFLAQVILISCAGDNAKEEQTLSIFNISFSPSFDEDGNREYNVWKSTDRCTFAAAGNSGQTFSSGPLVPGGSSSEFRVMLPSQYAENEIYVTYPGNAGFTFGEHVNYEIPSVQDGKPELMMLGMAGTGTPSSARDVTLNPAYGLIVVETDEGKTPDCIEISAKGKENISGHIKADLRSGSFIAEFPYVKMESKGILGSGSGKKAFMLSPGELSEGIILTVKYTSGETISEDFPEIREIKQGESIFINADGSYQKKPAELAVCGDNMIYLLRPEESCDFKSAVYWSLDVRTLSDQLGLDKSRCNHMDECKVVENGSRLLATSSYGFAFLMDIATRKLIWCSNRCPNAHSAELLPNNRVAVATSSGEDAYNRKVLIYDLSRNHQEIFKYEVRSCHGLVWDSANEVLYASGLHETDNSRGAVFSFRLKNWESTSPSLELVNAAYAPAGSKSVHDICLGGKDKLVAAGTSAWFINTGTGSFSEKITHFSQYSQIKSLNYNASTGECWYTCADRRNPVPDKESSTRQICYTANIGNESVNKIIETPQDIYKVRVINW